MKRENMIQFARSLDFDIYDFAVVDTMECVAKKLNDDTGYVYWPIEIEGSGFNDLFRGFSKYKDDWKPMYG
jgi:hypothetical protein